MAQKKLAALAAALLALVAAAVPAAAAEASADAQVQLLPGEQPAVGYKQLPRPPNELGQEDLHATMDAWLER